VRAVVWVSGEGVELVVLATTRSHLLCCSGQGLVIRDLANIYVSLGLRQPDKRLAWWCGWEEIAREIVIELVRYHRHPTDCIRVMFTSKQQQRL
jgi:hypothetical protein